MLKQGNIGKIHNYSFTNNFKKKTYPLKHMQKMFNIENCKYKTLYNPFTDINLG